MGDSLQEPRESIKVKMAVASGLGGVPDAEVALCEALRRAAEGTAGWAIEPVNHDGLRCAVGSTGWLIIRGSLHEPSVSVQTESDEEGGTAAICRQLLQFEQGECEAAGIDLTPLRQRAAMAPAAGAWSETLSPEVARRRNQNHRRAPLQSPAPNGSEQPAMLCDRQVLPAHARLA